MRHVVVDTREPRHIAQFFRKKGWTVRRETLHAGDIADDQRRVRFERKNGTDLIASIYDGRLFTQCGKLYDKQEEEGCLAYVVVSGDIIESVNAYTEYIRKGLAKKQKKRIYRKTFKLNISTPQIYKKLSMIPYDYDVNVLWFITEDEALETIHYMLQEVMVSEPFQRRISKRKQAKKKKTNVRSASRSRNKHSTNAKRDDKLAEDVPGETEEEKFRRLGLI